MRQADQERIAQRADAAAAVALKLQERAELSGRLIALERELTDLVAAATTTLMTDKELADFVGVKPAELVTKSVRRAPRKRRVTAVE